MVTLGHFILVTTGFKCFMTRFRGDLGYQYQELEIQVDSPGILLSAGPTWV